MRFRPSAAKAALSLAIATLIAGCGGSSSNSDPTPAASETGRAFNRVASFFVCNQVGSSCESDDETAAEIVAASTDGMTLIYTNSPGESVGFVDITDPAAPTGLGAIALGGEPTSVAVLGGRALVAVNTSADFVNVSGQLVVIDIASRSVEAVITLAGQPDSVAVSPDGAHAVIAIENERDEDLGDGAPPQAPAGLVQIVDTSGAPAAWTVRDVAMTGLADLYPTDPEPEYVDINADGKAVVTLQENNHLVLIDVASGAVTADFSAGTADLVGVDLTDERPNRVSQTETALGVLREPDGVSWLSTTHFATADEGDLNGGSRGFTIFDTAGNTVFQAGTLLEYESARLGHYPDRRSDAKGNETENAEYAQFGDDKRLLLCSERASLVYVFDVSDPAAPVHLQTLPAALGPEGVLAIPSRGLVIAASEEDSRGDAFRSALNIYQLQDGAPVYPTLRSADRADGSPIPWGALSGLAADPTDANRVYAIDDSFYAGNRIFSIDLGQTPAVLDAEMRITDAAGVLAGLAVPAAADVDAASTFDADDLAAMINADGTVNLDPEGIATASGGGFWIASEGAGTVGEAARPVTSANLILRTDSAGVIQQVIRLPEAVDALQVRFGFEGVAESDGGLVVAFQRAWAGESNPRLGLYDLASATWSFVYYPLDTVESPNGGWVGLSDITPLGNNRFLLVERDNQAGPDARIKRLYRIDLAGVADGATVSKTLVRDLMDDLAVTAGPTPEKIEGLTRTASGEVVIINDNDGVNDNNGETWLIRLGAIAN
ncbi:MAG: esterase-like activity of phytase family protein [Rhodocyclaceae bacterium]|nr:esterase-like activity of phytase family protein [Rhodocyclaceae bacterium]